MQEPIYQNYDIQVWKLITGDGVNVWVNSDVIEVATEDIPALITGLTKALAMFEEEKGQK